MGGKPRRPPVLTPPPRPGRCALLARPRGVGPAAWPRLPPRFVPIGFRPYPVSYRWALVIAEGRGWAAYTEDEPPLATLEQSSFPSDQIGDVLGTFYSAVAEEFPFEFLLYEL